MHFYFVRSPLSWLKQWICYPLGLNKRTLLRELFQGCQSLGVIVRLVSDHVDFYHYYAAVQIWLKNVYVDLGTDVGRLEVEHGMMREGGEVHVEGITEKIDHQSVLCFQYHFPIPTK